MTTTNAQPRERHFTFIAGTAFWRTRHGVEVTAPFEAVSRRACDWEEADADGADLKGSDLHDLVKFGEHEMLKRPTCTVCCVLFDELQEVQP